MKWLKRLVVASLAVFCGRKLNRIRKVHNERSDDGHKSPYGIQLGRPGR